MGFIGFWGVLWDEYKNKALGGFSSVAGRHGPAVRAPGLDHFSKVRPAVRKVTQGDWGVGSQSSLGSRLLLFEELAPNRPKP